MEQKRIEAAKRVGENLQNHNIALAANETPVLGLMLSDCVSEIERLQKERDVAVEQNEFRKHRPLTAIFTYGGHGYSDDDNEDFWCPICHQHLGTHVGFATECPHCGQAINSDSEPLYEYRDMVNSRFYNMPKWRGLED